MMISKQNKKLPPKAGAKKASDLKRCRELGRDEANRELPHQGKDHEESQGNHERPRSLHRLPPKEYHFRTDFYENTSVPS